MVPKYGRHHLRPSSYRTLAVPRTRTTLGDRSFAATGLYVEQFTGYYKTYHQLWTVLAASENTFIYVLEIAADHDC